MNDREGELEFDYNPTLSLALLNNTIFSDMAVTSSESHLILRLSFLNSEMCYNALCISYIAYN